MPRAAEQLLKPFLPLVILVMPLQVQQPQAAELHCLFTGNKAAAARVRNSALPQTAALENPSSTFPHVTLHPVSNLQETKGPIRVIQGCETLGTSVIKTQTPKLRSSAIKQIILQLAGLPLMYLRTIFK